MKNSRCNQIAGKVQTSAIVPATLTSMDFRTRIYNRPMHDVVVYSRKGCHLCDIVKETLEQLQGDADFQWHDVDIDLDPQLREKYNDEVPVVFIDGRKAFKYSMNGHQFLSALLGRE